MGSNKRLMLFIGLVILSVGFRRIDPYFTEEAINLITFIMLYLIGIPNCNKIKDTRSWLEEKGITYEFVHVKKEPLSKDEISDLAHKVGVDVLVNTRGTTYRKLEIKDKNLSDEELLELVHEHQSMLKRPILVLEESVLVGFDEEAFEQFAKQHELLD